MRERVIDSERRKEPKPDRKNEDSEKNSEKKLE